MNQLSCSVQCLSNFHSNYLPMIFSLWFLSCQYCSWNPLFTVFCSLFLLSFRWVSVNNVWIIPVSCELLLSPSALPFPCTSLYDSAVRFEKDCPFSLWFAVILIEGKRQRAFPERDGLHAVEYCGGLYSAALVAVGLRHMEIKANVTGDWGLWSLSGVHGVHCLGLTRSLLTLLASRETDGHCI